MSTTTIRNPFCDQLHGEKYRLKGETHREAMTRVASGLQDSPGHFRALRDILLGLRFLPAGRVQAAIGAPRAVTPYNCYVAPTIEDSFTDGTNSIMDVATKAATTMRMGGGIGYDWSTLRPSGDLITKLGSRSSGPVAFMQINNAVCKATASAGDRRGAQMGVMRVDHPDIEQFITAKQPPACAQPVMDAMDACQPGSTEWQQWNNLLQNLLPLSGFNVSVGITDEFMHAVEDGAQFTLRFSGKAYSTVDATALWEKIMRSTWDWAEPGVLFIDQINRMNNLWYCERIAATNPCGEQPLPPNGACLLGSFNLVKYLVPFGGNGWEFDFGRLDADIPDVVRAMDNIVDLALYPTYEQEKEAKSKRRMGLGVTGLANTVEALGHSYGSDGFLVTMRTILEFVRDKCYEASAYLAKEKGAFPMFEYEPYLEGEFIQTLPEDVRALIESYGIRNSHLLSIAPTGTISLCADNISSGIEPVFAYEYDRTIRMDDGSRTVKVRDYAVEHLGVKGKPASQVTVKQHVDVLVLAQSLVDSAVSKTCNVLPNTPWEDFKQVYMDAWRGGAKGCTTFTTGGRRFGILNVSEDVDDSPASTCEIDPASGRRSCE